jgi:hypothetical protein
MSRCYAAVVLLDWNPCFLNKAGVPLENSSPAIATALAGN